MIRFLTGFPIFQIILIIIAIIIGILFGENVGVVSLFIMFGAYIGFIFLRQLYWYITGSGDYQK